MIAAADEMARLTEAPPAELGFDPAKLADAVAFAETQAETRWPRDLSAGLAASGEHEPPPWNEIIGPTRPRGGPNGMILRHGRIAAQWGDIDRADMTFSVAKSYLSLLAGIAVGDGLIRDLDDPIRDYGLDDGFDSAQNRTITWRHMLTQTSEWEGTLWDKPDLVDRHRQVGVAGDNSRKGTFRKLRRPGAFWEYNDVRVNRLALSLTELFKCSLADVLNSRIMEPIGASDRWEWHAYENAWTVIDGARIPSVPGGSHWGGGLWISTRDHLRVGYLLLRDGEWNGVQVLPPGWVDETRRPLEINPQYGLLWWLNTGGAHHPSAPEGSYFAMGAGYNVIWVDPELDLVAVARWIDQRKIDELIARVMASLE